jgi:hypothetical protein
MSSLDDELRQLTPLPLDLQLAVNEILKQASINLLLLECSYELILFLS